ncbi:MAG: cell division protein FtsZ [Burkholderiaceae bacterium]|jgi:hypothetical protein|nr:cell division protein FtsZ [Burkholderiaceae bacterium]
MSSLTFALAILGGLVLAAFIAWNTWMLRRNAPRQPSKESNAWPAQEDEDPDVDEPIDPPPAAGAGATLSGTPDLAGERCEPLLDSDIPVPGPSASPVTGSGARGGLDALIDVIVPIALDLPVSGDAVLSALPATRRAGSKPVMIEGLSRRDEPGQSQPQWEPPAAGQRYYALQAGMQLVNRAGALNEIEYSEFVVKVNAFADALGGTPEFPEMLDQVARARELDQFAGAHDAQLSFVLRARHAAWSPGYVQQAAARLGFTPGVIPGRLVLPAVRAGFPPILVLAFDTQAALADDPAQFAIRELTISLDVPQVERGERPFERMREIAAALAHEMDGAITDSDGQPLREDTIEIIGADLEQLYDTLEARDLAAGTPLARRLFS